jgi:ribosomal protein S18 acetylase RimI-like enzyme
VGHLGAVYVRPDHWASGVGSALLGQFETWCRERDCTEIQLHVLSENTRARSFYRNHGYESVETEQTDLFGEQLSEHVFRGPIED